jgi:creatinine amidohydrolase
MTWEEIAEAARADTPIVIPVGATEQHGRHLPVCTDWVLPEQIIGEASRFRNLIVGPFIPFGYRSRPGSGGGQHFPGTVSLRATTFMSVLEDVLSELKRTGFRTSPCTTGTTKTPGSSTSRPTSCPNRTLNSRSR